VISRLYYPHQRAARIGNTSKHVILLKDNLARPRCAYLPVPIYSSILQRFQGFRHNFKILTSISISSQLSTSSQLNLVTTQPRHNSTSSQLNLVTTLNIDTVMQTSLHSEIQSGEVTITLEKVDIVTICCCDQILHPPKRGTDEQGYLCRGIPLNTAEYIMLAALAVWLGGGDEHVALD
jgi:hypothetical protein